MFCWFLFQILEGVSDIRDESDRSGMRIVIEVWKIVLIAAVYITI